MVKNSKDKSNIFETLEILSLIIVSILSIIIGILDMFGLFDNTFLKEKIISIILVLCGIIAGNLFIERRGILKSIRTSLDTFNNMVDIKGVLEKNLAFFEGFKGNRFSELKLIYGLRKYSNTITENKIFCSKDQVFTMWSDVLMEANSFYAFNYSSPTEVWGTKGWAFNIAQALQNARIKQGCIIKRIFIVDTVQELEKLRGLLQIQKDSNIEVRWILKENLTNDKLFTDYLKEIGSSDFIAVDNDLTYVIFIDEERSIDGSLLVQSREINNKAMFVFNEAFHSGQEI